MNNETLLKIIKEISNSTKFRIIKLTQNEAKNISEISKITKIAYNKCSNYCSQLEKLNLVEKNKIGKEVFIKSKVNINNLKKIFSDGN